MKQKLLRVTFMKFTFYSFFIGMTYGHSQMLSSINQTLEESGKFYQTTNRQLGEVLTEIKQIYQVDIMYELKTVEGVTVSHKLIDLNQSLEKNLEKILFPIGLNFKKYNKTSYVIKSDKKKKILGLSLETNTEKKIADTDSRLDNLANIEELSNLTPTPVALKSIQRNIKGIVTDENGEGLFGVTILIKGTSNGTSTEADGSFNLSIPNEGATLIISYIGYLTQEISIINQNNIEVFLKLDSKVIDEVVVIGYGTRKKTDLTGSVTSLGSKDFKDQPIYRVDQALQGRAAGVSVVNNAGAPGGDVSIRIRGSNSILGDNNPLFVIDGFIGADFNNINPRDIESIEVLKDASSTAIYGSRGANGVIIVTTKKGTQEKVLIEYTSTFTNASVLKKFDLLSAYDFAILVNQKNKDLNLNPIFTQDQITNFQNNGGTDWQNEIFRTALGQEHQLSISGGNLKTNYFVSGNLFDENGVILNSGFKRIGIRSNINSKVSEKLNISLNFSAIQKQSTNTQGADGKNSVLTQALAWAPTTPIYDQFGNFTISDPVGSIAYNPVALSLDRVSDYVSTNGIIIGRANYQIIRGLTFDLLLGADYLSGNGGYFGNNSISNNTPYNGRYTSETINIQNSNILSFNRLFNKVHNLTITGVLESQSFKNKGFNANANNLLFPNLSYDNLTLAGTITSSASYSKSGLLSYIGRLNYSFKDKYLLTASLRRDGSSKFQEKNKFSTFPSAAIAWKVSEEPFMQNLSFFEQLKLRLSYGITGSQAINPYGTLSSYYSDAGTSFNNTALLPNLLIGNPGNAGLKWETTKSLDAGLDMSIFKGKLTLSFDYYKKNTSDLLMPLPVPAYIGGGNIISNVGEIQNSGLELSLNATPVSNMNFSWTTTLVSSFLKNKVISLGEQKIYYYRSNIGAGLSTQPEFALVPGYGVGSYWGLKYLGTWKSNELETAKLFGNKPGDARYEDVNGDKKINSSDFQIMGNGMPKTSIGWNNTFQYKGFSLNVFIQALMGFDKLNYTYGASIAQSADARQATLSDIKNRFVLGSNENSDIPAFSSSSVNYLQSTRFLEKGDFIRIKNLNLSYDLPADFIKKCSLKIYLGGINLFTFTKYKGIDPESSSSTSGTDLRQGIDYGSYPNAKKLFAGIVLKF